MNIFRVEEVCLLLSNKGTLKFKGFALGASLGSRVFGFCSSLWQRTQRKNASIEIESEDFSAPDELQIQALLEASELDFGMGDSSMLLQLQELDCEHGEQYVSLGDRNVSVSVQRADGQLSKEILQSDAEYGEIVIALHLKRPVINGDLSGLEDTVFEMAGTYGCSKTAVKLLNDACKTRGSSKRLSLTSDDSLVMYDDKGDAALVVDPRGYTTIKSLKRLSSGEVAVENSEVLNANPETFLREFATTLVQELMGSSKESEFVAPANSNMVQILR